MTSVIIMADRAGSRALVDTADSVAREGTTPVEILLAVSRTDHPPTAVDSLASRLGAHPVHGETPAASINEAAQRATGEYLVLLQPPWRLQRGMIDICTQTLEEAVDCALLVPALRLQSADGRTLQTIALKPTLSSVLADPRAIAPVVAVRRETWRRIGGFDERAGMLAGCDWWLRLLATGRPVAVVDEPLATLTASDADWWPPVSTVPLDLTAYRALLETHRDLLERDMAGVLVERELAFGRLADRHRLLVARRDERLLELERLRAETAHNRAYLEHHGRNSIEWGDLRRTDPISRDWGYDRGMPIDRYYIERFLAAHSSDIAGSVLEVQEDDFTQRFGGPRVARCAVIDLDDSNRRATIVADLRAAHGLQDAQFDCIVLTQTLHVIDDMTAVLRECHRLLKAGGVLLLTLPCASRVCLEYGEDGDLWRLTPAGARALVEPVFGVVNVDCVAYGSVLTNVAFMHGLACSELTEAEFGTTDAYHPVLVGVRARKSATSAHRAGSVSKSGIVLLYHSVGEREDVHELTLSAASLEQQFSWLTANCNVMPLESLLADAGRGLPARSVAITFDDGYLDTLEYAAPLLQRFGLPATVFATTRWLDETGEYWWDLLERALLGDEVPAHLSVEIQGRRVTLPTATRVERRAAHDRLHAHLVHARLDERDRTLAEVAAWAGCGRDARRRPMTAEELKRLARLPGVSIGAHGVNHLALPDQPADVQAREIVESVSALERAMDRRVELFAYPYGAVDRTARDLARTACSWSLGCEAAALGDSFDAAQVPRLEVKRWDAPRLVLELGRLLESRVASRQSIVASR